MYCLGGRHTSDDYVKLVFADEIQKYSLSQLFIRQLMEFYGSRNRNYAPAPSSTKALDYGSCGTQTVFASSLSVAKDTVLAEDIWTQMIFVKFLLPDMSRNC